MAGDNACRIGEEYVQNGHGLPVKLPLKYLNSEGSNGRRGSSDDGHDSDGGRSAGVASEELPDLINKGMRNEAVKKLCNRCGNQFGRTHYCPGCEVYMYAVCGVGIGKEGHR